MDRVYDAFISYRHTPRDIRAASDIQRMLEHFRIPRAIKKQTGMRRIEHVFRDKEDLSITSDLNDTIDEALGSARYLIVICSPEAKQSTWVQKEIEFFLQTHTRRDILTVVTEGEPADVIPDILRFEDIVQEDADGNPVTVRIEREPLCCDWRLPRTRAKREELPRLAAAILGCSYDDLRRRQRQYRTRRTAILLSILIAILSLLAGYYAWSAGQIRKNYEQSLINQSRYLSSESAAHFADGDRLTAMLLALHGLPDETTDRPIVPGAIDALVQSSYAYVSPGTDSYALQYAYRHAGTVNRILSSDDGDRLLTVSGFYTVSVWDSAAQTELYSKKFTGAVEDVAIDSAGNFIILADEIVCVEANTGVERWRYTPTETQYVAGGLACAKNTPMAAFSTSSGVVVLDTNSGTVKGEYTQTGAYDRPIFCCDVALSDDGSMLAAASLSEDTILLWNVSTTLGRTIQNPMVYVNSLGFDEENALYVTVSTGMDMNITYGDVEYLMTRQQKLVKISSSGHVVYETEFSHAQRSFVSDISFMRFEQTSGQATDSVICTGGNCCHVFDRDTGKLIKRIEFPAPIVAVQADGLQITAVLQDGQRAFYHCANGIVKSSRSFVDALRGAELFDGGIYVWRDEADSVLLYRTGIYDAAWNCVVEEAVTEYLPTQAGLLCLNEAGELILISPAGQPLWRTPLAMSECVLFDAVGYDPQSNSVVVSVFGQQDTANVQQYYICLIDMEDGSQEFLTTDSTARHFCINDGRLYYTVDQSGTCFLGIFRIKNHDLKAVELEKMLTPNGLFVSNDRIVITTHDGETYLAEENGKCTLLHAAQSAPDIPLVCFGDDSIFALCADDALQIFDRRNVLICSIPLNGHVLRAAALYEGCIYFAADDGKLACYDVQSADLIGETDIIGAEFASTQTQWVWNEETLSLRLGKSLNLIDRQAFAVYTRVENCIAHYDAENMLYTLGQSAGGHNRVGFFAICDLDTLITRARDQLDGLILTPRQCSQFGLVQ